MEGAVAIYRFDVSEIKRSKGRRVVQAAAYRAGTQLHDNLLDRDHDYTNKAGVIASEILLPDGAPERWRDRETLWNEVERSEKRKDAQLAREIVCSLPAELGPAQATALVRAFVQREFVDKGMVADLNVHWHPSALGNLHPHAHILLTLREITPDGFGLKDRVWRRTAALVHWRQAWAECVNEGLARAGIDARVDHRSLRDQGVDLDPLRPVPLNQMREAAEGKSSPAFEKFCSTAERNGERIIRDPSIVLRAMTQQQSTFTEGDLSRLVFRYTHGKAQFDKAMSAVRTSRELIALGRDGRGQERYTSREMLTTEQDMARSAERMAGRKGHVVRGVSIEQAASRARQGGLDLGPEQAAALAHVVATRDLALVVGYAGSGKSAILGVAREVWERDGYRVQGATLSGVAAENLEQGSGIVSRTVASLELAWTKDTDRLTHRDVLVIDEAGLLGSRQMHRLLHEAERAGAKVVMVGDPEQLQAIEAGAAFRALTERHGAVEITHIRRQEIEWQRQATRELATSRTPTALNRYLEAGAVRRHDTRAEARSALVGDWLAARRESSQTVQMMLAHTRADVADLNRLAREQLKAAGELVTDHELETTRGREAFASGDRIMFLRNDRSLGVRNGTLGSVEQVSQSRMSVVLDSGHVMAFDPRTYGDITHGYAATIHKTQGVTVDRAYVLATPTMDRHSTYVALTRHRHAVSVRFGQDDFPRLQDLMQALSRERTKDVTLDYGIERRERQGPKPPERSAPVFVQAERERRRHASREDQRER